MVALLAPVAWAMRLVYYQENVYRTSPAAAGYREIMQAGLECIGSIDLLDMGETLSLAAESLALLGGDDVRFEGHKAAIGVCEGQNIFADQKALVAGVKIIDGEERTLWTCFAPGAPTCWSRLFWHWKPRRSAGLFYSLPPPPPPGGPG